MVRCVLQVDLPDRAVSNPRTRRVAAAFEMELAAHAAHAAHAAPAAHPARPPRSANAEPQAGRDAWRGKSPPGGDRAVDQSGGPSRLIVLDPTEICLAPGELAYLVGPSGSGKTAALRALRRRWPGPVVAGCLGESPERSGRPVLDLFAGNPESALRLLCLAGLAEPRLWLAPARCLSAGQADRLALARLFERVEKHAKRTPGEKQTRRGREGATPRGPVPFVGRPILLLIDEFGSRLDRLTAAVLARNLRRWLARKRGIPLSPPPSSSRREFQGENRGVAIVVATAHDDLVEPLAPDWVWIKTAESGLVILRGAEASIAEFQAR